MPTPQVISDLTDAVSGLKSVGDSAVALIDGFAQRQADAIAAALANGATEAELQPLTQLNTDIRNESQALADAVLRGTPADPGNLPPGTGTGSKKR